MTGWIGWLLNWMLRRIGPGTPRIEIARRNGDLVAWSAAYQANFEGYGLKKSVRSLRTAMPRGTLQFFLADRKHRDCFIDYVDEESILFEPDTCVQTASPSSAPSDQEWGAEGKCYFVLYRTISIFGLYYITYIAEHSKLERTRQQARKIRDRVSALNDQIFHWAANADQNGFGGSVAVLDEPLDGIIGGDFYWARRSGDWTIVVIGDASGHDAYAGALKLTCGVVLKDYQTTYLGDQGSNTARPAPSPAQVWRFLAAGYCEILNAKEMDGDDGVNLLVFVIDSVKGELRYLDGGIPLYEVCLDHSVNRLGDEHGDHKMLTRETDLKSEDFQGRTEKSALLQDMRFLFSVTDGIVDQPGVDRGRSEYGEARLKGTIHDYLSTHPQPSARGLKDAIVDSVKEFGGSHRIDDHLALVLDISAFLGADRL